jgi:hypothetical protein
VHYLQGVTQFWQTLFMSLYLVGGQDCKQVLLNRISVELQLVQLDVLLEQVKQFAVHFSQIQFILTYPDRQFKIQVLLYNE